MVYLIGEVLEDSILLDFTGAIRSTAAERLFGLSAKHVASVV